VSIASGARRSADDLIWSERGTTPDKIEAALRELLRERYASNRRLMPARVLNLVVVLDRAYRGEIANRLEHVGRYQASRTVICAVEEGRSELDALAVMSYDQRTAGGIGVMRETVEIELGPAHLGYLDTIIDPVVISELPTMMWSPHGYDEAVEAVRDLIDVMLLDSDELREPPEALAHAAELLSSAYVVDLAWLRTTPWRERLAASFDPGDLRMELADISGLAIRHRPTSTASALLLAGWLCTRLHWEPRKLAATPLSLTGTACREAGDDVTIELVPIEQDSPGMAGVTVSCDDGYSLSLDRGKGGLRADECMPDGSERVWRVLGASRGEGGILGEGVRQALLRDTTYSPALAAAQELCPE
jgi:glucose-6-phosphate dehydrogenase assembly protein OpcA